MSSCTAYLACATARLRARRHDQQYWPGINPGGDAKLCQANPGTYAIGLISWALGSQLSPSSINLAPVKAGKVTVGLASHWPCVTDNSGITTYGLMALGREMSTPPKLQ